MSLKGLREVANVKDGGCGSRGAVETAAGQEPNSITPYALYLKNRTKGKYTTEEKPIKGDKPCLVLRAVRLSSKTKSSSSKVYLYLEHSFSLQLDMNMVAVSWHAFSLTQLP